MKRAALLLCGSLLAGTADAADHWTGLWLTPDQQGERLLRHGDAAAAAHAYADPRHKAYAELQAGDYARAAQDFAGFDDSDAHYNRGNALAHAGDLQQALQAYDTALARNPDNADARHNRELVEQALKQQQQQQQQNGKDGKDGKDGKPQPGQDGQQNQGGGSDQQNASADQKNQQGQSASAQNQQGQQEASGKDGGDGKQQATQQNSPQNGGGQDRQDASRQQAQQNAAAGDQQPAQAGTPNNGAPGADDAAQARRDAASSLKQAPAGRRDGGGQPLAQQAQADGARPSADAQTVPRTEQQLAEQQWLRRIPDDPGGLLRRKFMIEHMLRQQGAEPAAEQDQQP